MLVLTALLASSSLVYADEAKPAPRTSDASQMHTDDCARASAQHRACVIDMGTCDEIEGAAANGTGNTVTLTAWTKAGSLIRLRRDFITEIIKSAEDL
ncbi:hypothetical protein BH11MYX1_BH11MYX1_49960 [soil metagenome]